MSPEQCILDEGVWPSQVFYVESDYKILYLNTPLVVVGISRDTNEKRRKVLNITLDVSELIFCLRYPY